MAPLLRRTQNVLGGSFIYCLKDVGTPVEMAQVTYVAHGFGDRGKAHMAHDATSLRASSIRVILFVAAILGFRLFSHDVAQAYLQIKYRMTQAVYITPKPCDRPLFGLSDREVLKLVMPLYGICNAGDYWGITVSEHNVIDLGMLHIPGDSALYVKQVNRGGANRTIGITRCYVDNALNTGTAEFETFTESTLRNSKASRASTIWSTFMAPKSALKATVCLRST